MDATRVKEAEVGVGAEEPEVVLAVEGEGAAEGDDDDALFESVRTCRRELAVTVEGEGVAATASVFAAELGVGAG